MQDFAAGRFIPAGSANCYGEAMDRNNLATLSAAAGSGLLLFSAFRRGALGMLAFFAATALIVHAAVQRGVDVAKR
jgi:hypothetical protein